MGSQFKLLRRLIGAARAHSIQLVSIGLPLGATTVRDIGLFGW